MRITWIFAILATFTAAASASPNLNFQVVIQSNDPVLTDGGQPSGDSFSLAGQVVVGTGGSVGIVATTSSPNPVLLYRPAASNIVQTLATGGDLVNNNADDPIIAFDNLALSGNGAGQTRVTFAAEANSVNAGKNLGVFQQDIGVNAAPQTVAFGTAGSIRFNSVSNPNLVPLQVNANGQVVFAAQNASNADAVYLGNLAGASTLYTNGDGGNPNLASQTNRLGIFAPGAPTVGAAVLKGVNSDVYIVGNNNASLAGSAFHTVQTGPTILGTGNDANGNATLFYSQTGDNASYVFHDSANDFALDGFTDAAVTGVKPEVGVDAEMSPGRKVAAYVPDASGGHLDFYDPAIAGHTPTIVAQTGSTVVNDPTGPAGAHYVIQQLQAGLLAPMVNDHGVVIFDANIDDTNPSDADPLGSHQALLEWQPNAAAPTILLQDGDFIPGLSDPLDPTTSVAAIFINGLGTESDGFKDSLSDDNYLAVDVLLNNGNSAVLLTQLTAIPEPAAAATVPLAAVLLLGRRRRQTA